MLSLSIDIGNTRTKFGLFRGRSLIKTFVFASDQLADADSLVEMKVEKAIVSSVLSLDQTVNLLAFLKMSLFFVDAGTKLPFTNLYHSPETLGKDRIAAVAGAAASFPGEELLVVDAGTCITFDFLNKKMEYIGGSISPGIQMRFKALHGHTAKLPHIPWIEGKKPDLAGKNTESAILSGVVNGCLAEVDGIISSYKEDYSGLKTIITGGDSPFFEKNLKNTIFADPNLVLKGLNEIQFYNSENF